jgi:hypothetical protein
MQSLGPLELDLSNAELDGRSRIVTGIPAIRDRIGSEVSGINR